jgi:hypothetical protein
MYSGVPVGLRRPNRGAGLLNPLLLTILLEIADWAGFLLQGLEDLARTPKLGGPLDQWVG